MQQGRLGFENHQIPGRRPEPRIREDDVERIAGELRKSIVLPPSNEATGLPAVPDQMSQAIARLAEALTSLRSAEPVLYMTLDQAADYTRMPRGMLARFIRRGQLPAERFRQRSYIEESRYRYETVWWIRTADLKAFAFGRNASPANLLAELAEPTETNEGIDPL